VKKATQFVIKDIKVETIRDKKKLVLSFEGTDKKLALNSTNARHLEEAHGSDYKKWTKTTITLAAVPTTFNGEQVKGLRVL
jgi:hypothetical protein